MTMGNKSCNLLIAFAPVLSRYSVVHGIQLFSYDSNDENGPSHWSFLNLADNQCGGQQQSGIDIPTDVSPCDPSSDVYEFTPGDCLLESLDFQLNDHGVNVEYPKSGCQAPTMIIPGDASKWKASSFHIHLGSEHALSGSKFDAEFHMVHQQDSGNRLAVLSLLLKSSTSSDDGLLLNDILVRWEEEADSALLVCSDSGDTADGNRESHRLTLFRESTFNPYKLLSDAYSIYQYQGSLTTPPCTEIVTWNVVDSPILVPIEEHDRLQSLILDYVNPDTCQHDSVASPSGFTSRPLNPLNGRSIVRFCSISSASVTTDSPGSQRGRRRPP